MQDQPETTIATDSPADESAVLVQPKQFKSLTLDLSLYDDYLRDPALPDDVRQDMLKAIWTIIGCFIDLNIPIELEEAPAAKSCGEVIEMDCLPAGDSADLVESQPDTLTERGDKAGRETCPPEQEEA